jgi:Epoxide hydrolase N terminus
MSGTAETANEIHPFHVDSPDEALEDLRRRIAATNWPEKETVADQSQGVPLAMILVPHRVLVRLQPSVGGVGT